VEVWDIEEMEAEEMKKKGGGKGRCLILFFMLLSFFSVHFVGAQTAAAVAPVAVAPVAVAVTPFAGDDAVLSGRIRGEAVAQVEGLAGFMPQPLDGADSYTDAPPDPGLLEGAPYVLTGEYYFDIEDMQHLQMWLWNSESGALVFTDELVAENVDEAAGYLPPLVAWVFAQVPVQTPETGASVPEGTDAADEAAADGPAADGPAAERPATDRPAMGSKRRFPRLYLGVRAGAALDFLGVQPAGGYEGKTVLSWGGEAALTVEYRPWRFLSVQAEGVLGLESFGADRLDSNKTTDRYRSMYLRVPLMVKAPIDLGRFRVSPLAGASYILPLNKLDLPLGVTAGFDFGYALRGRRGSKELGELYGSIRYDIDLGLTEVERTGLQYTRGRLVFSAGWKFGLINK
jgi:hypothetical protein